MTSRYLLPFIHQSQVIVRDHFQCHCIIVRQYAFLKKFGQYSYRKYWNYVLGNENMTVIYTINEWSLNSCFVYVTYILPYSPMIWRYDKVVRQKRSHATSRHSFITTVWWYNILYQTPCIRQATFFNFKGKHT